MGSQVRLLIVDDELHVRSSLAAWFRDEGYQVALAGGGHEALEELSKNAAEIMLVDIKMPGMDGLALQRHVRKLAPDTTIIIMTAYAAVDTAVQALKEGAYDYIVKPFDPEELTRLVRKAAERYLLMAENRALRERIEAATVDFVTAGEGGMREVLEQVDQVAPTDTAVLVTGDSGTGKELLARLIHARSKRCFFPLVTVNCGALAEGVLESELYGHQRGAFSGAITTRRGKIELANGGTLFLDEIGDVPAKVQVDLLRVLQEKQITRVGSNTTIQVDFRLICATHRDLRAEVQSGKLREDFFFRINVFPIHLPPLRERTADILLLARQFLQHFAGQMSKPIHSFSPEALAALEAYPWPGNVRELQNAVERAAVLCRGQEITPELFPFSPKDAVQPGTLAAVEEAHIMRVLAECGYNITRAAKILDVDRVTLYNKMKKYKIERP